MFSEKRIFGNRGEEICVKILQNSGYKIVARNYLKPQGEIDIVALRKNRLHFIEVKTVHVRHKIPRFTYRAEDNVHPQKVKRVFRTIQIFLSEKKLEGCEWQLDVMALYLDALNNIVRLEVIENIT